VRAACLSLRAMDPPAKKGGCAGAGVERAAMQGHEARLNAPVDSSVWSGPRTVFHIVASPRRAQCLSAMADGRLMADHHQTGEPKQKAKTWMTLRALDARFAFRISAKFCSLSSTPAQRAPRSTCPHGGAWPVATLGKFSVAVSLDRRASRCGLTTRSEKRAGRPRAKV
jgi:hypothetical protein